MARIFLVGVLLVFFGCSRSDPGGKLSPADKGVQPGGDMGGKADLAKCIVGKWKMADGSDYVLEFTREGTMSVKNNAGERQVRLPGDKDLPYAFTSETEVKVDDARGEQFFVFSVRIEEDRLTLRGKEGGMTIILSQDGAKEVVFPGSERTPLEFVQQK